ncbi:hypothetical protein BDV96DRAFT_631264 [Lophiotrema nucula]|uniref:Uncharacterized protein n=1 Tax=Lophiotrema nucula TaxID=690887 RepID=A0A6A5ZAI6_9PLEO|nr:hypothetical protein BDV96DRAFT_631264 [Lophiotrema nucula]
MAPPGWGPYVESYDGIPQEFQTKRPVPAGEDTNTRPIVIFFSYLALCAGLTVFVIQRLIKSYTVLSKHTTASLPPKKYVYTFAFLATASVATTWYYTFRYFDVSYQTWVMWRSYYQLDPKHLHWGLWLKHTSLFKEAWETAIIGWARYWWTHQIFFFACGLGLDLERKGIPRGVKHTWAFMLLGQIVAISFATNLFLLAVLLSPPPVSPAPTSGYSRKPKWLGPWLINLIALGATQYSAYLLFDEHYWHHPSFLPMVMVPHVALMVLPVARGLIPTKYFSDDNVEIAGKVYKYLWGMTIGGGVLLFLKITAASYGYSGIRGISDALLEHPAVSTVAFDVIFCWVTWITWWKIQGASSETVVGNHGDTDENDGLWSEDATTTTTAGGDYSGEIRRR